MPQRRPMKAPDGRMTGVGGGVADLFTAIGLAIALEGMAYALFPAAMKKMMAHVLAQPLNNLRWAGLLAILIGVGVVWLIRG